MTDKEKFRKEVEKLKSNLMYGACSSQVVMETMCKEEAYNEVLAIFDTMQEEPVSKEIGDYDHKAVMKTLHPELKEEPVSEDLNTVAKEYANNITEKIGYRLQLRRAVCFGAKWQKTNLWKPADGDDLPIIDREVIALFDNGKVGFAHRPPEYWDGKNIITGKVTRNYPKTYDKGGWNIPNVKYWLDCSIPNVED